VGDGQIGEPRIFRSAFCQQVTPGNSRLQSALGGGPLYDIGVYCINAARYIFQAEPQEVFAYGASRRNDSRSSEVQEMSAAVMRFPGDRLASFTCSFGAADRSSYTKGVLRMDPAYEMVGDLMIRQRFRATPVAIIALVPWLVVALGGWTLLLRSWR
jgi:predicted dehydrogenase